MDSATLENPVAPELANQLLPEQERLLTPLAGPSPAGRDLDGTLELDAFEVMCADPEQAVVKDVERADTRNWREIRRQACRLLEESKDLRVAVQLCRALMQLDGVAGFCAGLHFTSELAKRHWDTLYPPLDPEDGDATRRVNALNDLVGEVFVADLFSAPLFRGAQSKLVTGNDLLVAAASPVGRANAVRAAPHVAFAAIDAAGAAEVLAHLQLIETAAQDLRQLAQLIRERTGKPIQFDLLASEQPQRPGFLPALSGALATEYERLAPGPAPNETAAARNDAAEDAARRGNEIARREDVVMLLERICAYYARVEPSSPVPLLLQRAKRVAMMDFLEIVRDLADQGLPQVGMVAGIPIQVAE